MANKHTEFWLALLNQGKEPDYRARLWNGYLGWKLPPKIKGKIDPKGGWPQLIVDTPDDGWPKLTEEEREKLEALVEAHGGLELTRFRGHFQSKGRKEGSTMARKQRRYPPEFRREIVGLVRSGRSPEALAREFEPSASAIRKWAKQADLDEGHRNDGLTTFERQELRQARREIKRLRMERDILKKAAAWFARESGSIPGKDSSS